MGETDTSVKAAKGKGSGGGKTTVDTPIPLTITPKKTDYTVVLDKTGATPAAHPILTFDIKGPPNWYFDVQLSRKDSNKLGEGPGLSGAWDSSKTREIRRDTRLFSSWSNGEKTLKLDGGGKASYSVPLEWWKDQARRKRKDFDSEDIFYRVVASADSSGASPRFSTENGKTPPKLVIRNNLTAFQVVDLGWADGGITKSIRMEFTVREADTTEMYTFVQWMQGTMEEYQGPGSTATHPTHELYDIIHDANFPDFTIDRLHMDPRYWDGAYDISDDEKTASATDGPNQGNVAAPATHYWITIDFETRVHLNFEVPATVTITRKEGSAPVYGIVSGKMAAPEPLTLDSNTWNTRVLQVIKPDGTVDISHPNTFTNPAATPKGCFIATAAYGSPLAPPVQFLRELRDGVLRKTRWGQEFFDEYWKHYYRISPAIADAMNADAEIMQVMRWSIVEPWTAYMKLLVARPDWDEVDFDALLPAVRDFLLQARGDMERFLSVIEPPKSFKGRDAFEAVGELNVLLSFILRTGGKQYLRLMRRTRQLPLKYRKSDRAALVESLENGGRSAEEVKLILGEAVRKRTKRGRAADIDHDEKNHKHRAAAAGGRRARAAAGRLQGRATRGRRG